MGTKVSCRLASWGRPQEVRAHRRSERFVVRLAGSLTIGVQALDLIPDLRGDRRLFLKESEREVCVDALSPQVADE
jgi:hypothetical protein